MSISEDSLLQRLRTDVLWHRRRGNETIAKDIEEAEDRLSKAIDALQKIAAIENKEFGLDWDEIDEARQIAGAFLQDSQT